MCLEKVPEAEEGCHKDKILRVKKPRIRLKSASFAKLVHRNVLSVWSDEKGTGQMCMPLKVKRNSHGMDVLSVNCLFFTV